MKRRRRHTRRSLKREIVSAHDKPLQAYRANIFVIFIAAVAAIGGILFGFDTGVISGAILFIQKQYQLTPFENGLVVSSALIGAVIGAAVGGWFADRFGRKRLLMVASLIFIVGSLGSALAITIPHLVMSRGVLGFGVGVASFTAPLYISEVAPPRLRGALVSLNQLAITVGILSSYFIDAYFAAEEAWRWMLGVGVIPAAILFIGLLFLPYSPRWLCSVGRTKEAFDTLRRIRFTSHVRAEFAGIRASLETESTWRDMLKPWLLPAIWIGLGMGFFQQFSGINTVIYYAPTIFQFAGFDSKVVAILATSGIGAINVLVTIASLFLIDRVGRKPLLYIGMTMMTVCLFALSVSFELSEAGALRWIAFLCLFFYVAGFAISLGPIMWLMFTEIFPLRMRGMATSIMASLQWLFNFIVSLTFLTLVKYLHPSGTFALYGVICLLGLWFIYRAVPETKGVSLEKIEQNLRRGRAGRELGFMK